MNHRIKSERNTRPDPINAFVEKVTKRQNEALFESLIKAEIKALRPRITFSKLVAYCYASIFHLSAIITAATGIYLLAHTNATLCPTTVGAFLLLIVWLTRPRVGKFPTKVITRADAPTLYQYIDAMTQEMKTPSVAGVVLDNEFNAGFMRLGIPPRTLLTLGIPLWNFLNNQERIALLAHELAHGANGDSARTFYIQSARNSLIELSRAIYPQTLAGRGILGLLLIPFNILFVGIAHFFRYNVYILHYLLAWESRRAEYLADYLASTVSGTDATRSMIGKMYFSSAYYKLVEIGNRYGQASYAEKQLRELQEKAQSVSLEDLDQVSEPDPQEIARFDLSHPPIGYRMQLLKTHQTAESKIKFANEDEEKISKEINDAIQKYARHSRSVYDQDFEYQPSKNYKK